MARPAREEKKTECPVCWEAIRQGEVVVFDHGDLVHVRCWEDRVSKKKGSKPRPFLH